MKRRMPASIALLAALLVVGACDRGSRAVQAVQRECVDCHADDRAQSAFPRHLDVGFPQSCEDCHTQRGWSPASFDHRETPLVGAHSNATCEDCHAREPVSQRCLGCHEDDRARPEAPDHLADGFSSSCEDCHTVSAWKPATLDHTVLPFVGGHSAVACDACHPDADRPDEPRSTSCSGCHDGDRQDKTEDPNHLAEGFPSSCEDCHTVYGWREASFEHAKFPLVGKHSTGACGDCHDQDPVPTRCAGCHEQDRDTSKEPRLCCSIWVCKSTL